MTPGKNQGSKIYRVSELTGEIQALLEEQFDFIWVEGEISNFSAPVSGHYYMVLKDEHAQLRAVMFRTQARYLKFVPENGLNVIARGRIGVYAPRGEYQLILDYLEPMGAGALALAFEQVKKKLAAQGVFDREIKKPLPFLPQRVAVITSPTGAAIRDFLKIIHRRFANLEITIVPVRVQGDRAAEEMVRALDLANRLPAVDVIVLTRGGGSLEDLWAFNQEELALAIRRSEIPVVSAVGHEIDTTICDLAADFRAPTPSAAAEMLVVEKESLTTGLGELEVRLIAQMRLHLKTRAQQLAHLSRRLRDPRKRLADRWLRLDASHRRLVRLMNLSLLDRRKRLVADERSLLLHSPLSRTPSQRQRLDFQKHALSGAMHRRLREARMALSLMEKRARDLSPLSVLKRGYSITRKLPGEKVLRDVSNTRKGDRLQVLLAEGQLECRVTTAKAGKWAS